MSSQKVKKLILRIFWNIGLLFGLSYGGIFFLKEIKKVENKFKEFLKNV